MSGLPAVAAVDPPGLASATPGGPVREAALTTERSLFEYLAQQSLANSMGSAATLANPSALATQLSRHLRGFMDRANQQAEIGRKGRAMDSKEGTQTVSATQADSPRLHGGPAREQLSSLDPAAKKLHDGGISDQEYDDIIGAMMRVLRFSAETHAIATGASNTTKSMNTLMKGQ